MRYTTIGSGTISLTPGRACAGHLVEAGSARVLMDCGSGVAQRLAQLGVAWTEITHVTLTHFHIDHHADLPSLVFAWKYGILPGRSAPLEIIGPVGTRALLEKLAAGYGDWLLQPGWPLTLRELAPGEVLDLGGGVRLEALKVPHTAESVAYSIGRGSRRIVYSGDTGPSPELARWAHGADLLVLECSLPAAMAIPEHLTPEQCGAMAAEAMPRQLALVHFYPPVETVDVRALVGAAFAGPVTLTHDGWHFEIEDD